MQRSIRRFSFLNDLWDSIDIIEVEERKMKKLVLTMLSIAGMMLFTALPAKACTSYYVGKDCTKDGTTMYGRTEDISSRKDKVYKVIQAKHVGKNAVYKDESGATEFQAPIKVDTTYRYTICRDNEGDEDGYFGEFGTNSKGVTMSATTSASAAKSIRQYDPYVKNTGITEENLTDYILCQASTAREGVEILADVMDTIGAGEGNGLFIADKNEVWYFEMLLGHNYCAIKMPSNKAAVIPNCLVIGDVDLSDKENVIASPNLVKVAKNNGFYVPAQDGKGDINVKLSYTGKGYSAGNADRIRGGQYLLNGQDNTAIYTDDYQDIFINVKNVTVEKLYELAGYRYEDMNFGRNISRVIGVKSSAECHIFQIDSSMPAELATVQWVCMGNADMSTFVPFYGALLTDVSRAYKMEAHNYNSRAAYWIFRNVGFLCEDGDNRTAYGKGVKQFYTAYMTKMEELQKNVNAQMLNIYKNDKANLEYYATKLGIAIGDETMDFAKALYADIQTCKADGTTYEVSSLSADDITYDLSMVAAPAKKAESTTVTKPDTQIKKVVAPARVRVRAKALKGKKAKVNLKKVAQASGYEIMYSTNMNFTKKATKKVSTTKLTKTIRKLKKKKTYYIKARAYKLDGKTKVYGKWSLIKKVVIKK